MAGWLPVSGFSVVSVFEVLIIVVVVVAGSVVVGCIIWEFALVCLNSAMKLVSSASISVLWGCGDRGKINGVGGVAFIAAGGGVVHVCLVILRS